MFDLRFGIFIPQGMSWEDTLAQWKMVEELGFDCAGVVDHFIPTGGDIDRPFHEGWTLLTALATHTPRLRVAMLVSGNTYRNPVLLAKQAVTLDHVTGGRVDLGIGAGWYEREHQAFGWDFPPAGQRVDMLRESLQVIRTLLDEDRSTYQGEHYWLDDAPFQPKPVQPGGLPIMVGGQQKRMMRLVAEYADIWSIDRSPEEMRESGAVLDRHCADIGRDPATIRRSGFAVNRRVGRDPFASLDDFLTVTNDYLDAGASEIYFRLPELDQTDQLNVVEQAAQRFPELRQQFAQR